MRGTHATGNNARSTHLENKIIFFHEEDMNHVKTSNDGALVVTYKNDEFDAKIILRDGGSLTKILFLDVFESTGYHKKKIKMVNFPLIGFTECAIYPL